MIHWHPLLFINGHLTQITKFSHPTYPQFTSNKWEINDSSCSYPNPDFLGTDSKPTSLNHQKEKFIWTKPRIPEEKSAFNKGKIPLIYIFVPTVTIWLKKSFWAFSNLCGLTQHGLQWSWLQPSLAHLPSWLTGLPETDVDGVDWNCNPGNIGESPRPQSRQTLGLGQKTTAANR